MHVIFCTHMHTHAHTRTHTHIHTHTCTYTYAHAHACPQETRCSQLTLELTKEKAEVNSLNIKVKWAQNKLKTDTEAHKVNNCSVVASGVL